MRLGGVPISKKEFRNGQITQASHRHFRGDRLDPRDRLCASSSIQHQQRGSRFRASSGVIGPVRPLGRARQALAGNGHLVDGGYGLADAALTPFVSRLDELAMDWMWARRPNLAGWWDAVRERPSFGTVFDAFPDAKRKAGLRDAGLDSREAVEKILAS